MERRREPRFPINSAIRVILPGEPARTIEARLLDISATGIRFLSDETITAEGIAGIEVDHRLLLAEIRYSEPRGDKFVYGARRLHEISKDAQLGDAAGVVSEMLGDFHHHITDGIKRDSEAMAIAIMEKIVERRENGEPAELPRQPVAEPVIIAPPEKPPVPVETALPEPVKLETAPVQPVAVIPAAVSDVAPPEAPLPEPPKPQIEAPATAQPALAQRKADVRARPPARPAIAHPAEPAAVRQVDPVVAHPVAPLRVDPLDAARASAAASFASMQRSRKKSRGKRQGMLFVGVAAGLLLAAVMAVSLIQRHSQAKSTTVPAAASVAPAPAPAAASPSIPAPAAPADQPVFQHVRIRMVKPTWVSISVDGREYLKRTLARDEVRQFDFTESATISVSKGDRLDLTINGTHVPVAGGARRLELTPDGMVSVKLPEPR